MRSQNSIIPVICLLIPLLISGTLFAQAGALTVKLTDVKSTKGKILFALFNQEEGFPSTHQKAFQLKEVNPVAGTTTAVFENLPDGNYALAVFHDLNNDGKLNTNFMGIPKEPYGFSNNVRPTFSAPTYKEALFKHQIKTALSIQVK